MLRLANEAVFAFGEICGLSGGIWSSEYSLLNQTIITGVDVFDRPIFRTVCVLTCL
jgi:hypothetical protein